MTHQPTDPKAKHPRWARLLGWRRREGRLLRYAPTRRGWVQGAGLLLLIAVAAFAEYSMQPEFCLSCHLMEPYHESWRMSSHSDVSCTQCHFKPGLINTLVGKWQASSQAIKFVTGTFGSKPHAEVHDESCMRSGCHDHRLLEGLVNWTVPSMRGGNVTIRFDHSPHLSEERRGMHLRCVSCHTQMVRGEHFAVTLDACYLCHFKGYEHGRNEQALGGCRSCHEVPAHEIHLATGVFSHQNYVEREVGCENCHSQSIKGDGLVNTQVCWSCHNLQQQVAKHDDVELMHREHVLLHKVECTTCHEQVKHNLTAGYPALVRREDATHVAMNSGDCGQCHVQTHGGPADLYRGVGGRGVPEMPSPMFRAQVDCIGCHQMRKVGDDEVGVLGQTFVAVQDSCDRCHGDKYEGTLEQWKQTLDAHLYRAQRLYEMAEAAEGRLAIDHPDGPHIRRLLDDAAHNIRLVRLGHAVHNVNYATALLNAAIEWIEQALQRTEPEIAVKGVGD